MRPLRLLLDLTFDSAHKCIEVGSTYHNGLAEGNVDILNLELIKKGTNILCAVVCDGTCEGVGSDTDPDCPVRAVLDSVLDEGVEWDVVVVGVFFVVVFLEPGESEEIDLGKLDFPLIE